MTENYTDMLLMRRPVSGRRAHMTQADRAAQFAPFAALTGYEDTLAETARTTEDFCILGEDAKLLLDAQLRNLQQIIASRPTITILYFSPDSHKSGGAYTQFTGQLKRIDPCAGQLFFGDGTQISTTHLIAILP